MVECYVGEIRQFPGNFAPVGWVMCSGQLMPISEYETLYTLIGTTYGGDGQTTFAVPDLRGRFPIHQGSGRSLGQAGGAEQVTLTSTQMPVHTHPAMAAAGGGQSNPAGQVWATASTNSYALPPSNASMGASSLGPAGANQPHDNMQPYLTVNYIIAFEGIFPSQD